MPDRSNFGWFSCTNEKLADAKFTLIYSNTVSCFSLERFQLTIKDDIDHKSKYKDCYRYNLSSLAHLDIQHSDKERLFLLIFHQAHHTSPKFGPFRAVTRQRQINLCDSRCKGLQILSNFS